MSSKIGTVLIDVAADVSKLVDGFDKAQRESQQRSEKIVGYAKNIGAALAGIASVSAMQSLIKDSIDAADSTGKLAQKLGTTTNEISRLEYAAGYADVGINKIDAAMSAMIRRTENFKRDGTGAAAKAMDDLGLSVEFARENFTDTSTTFGILIDKLRYVEDETKRTAIAQDLFSKSAADVVRLTTMSADEMQRLGDEGERIGAVFSNEMAASAAVFNDNITQVEQNLTGLTNQVANELLPVLNSLYVKFMEVKDINSFANMETKLSRLKDELKELEESEELSWGSLNKKFWSDEKKKDHEDEKNFIKAKISLLENELFVEEQKAKLRKEEIDPNNINTDAGLSNEKEEQEAKAIAQRISDYELDLDYERTSAKWDYEEQLEEEAIARRKAEDKEWFKALQEFHGPDDWFDDDSDLEGTEGFSDEFANQFGRSFTQAIQDGIDGDFDFGKLVSQLSLAVGESMVANEASTLTQVGQKTDWVSMIVGVGLMGIGKLEGGVVETDPYQLASENFSSFTDELQKATTTLEKFGNTGTSVKTEIDELASNIAKYSQVYNYDSAYEAIDVQHGGGTFDSYAYATYDGAKFKADDSKSLINQVKDYAKTMLDSNKEALADIFNEALSNSLDISALSLTKAKELTKNIDHEYMESLNDELNEMALAEKLGSITQRQIDRATEIWTDVDIGYSYYKDFADVIAMVDEAMQTASENSKKWKNNFKSDTEIVSDMLSSTVSQNEIEMTGYNYRAEEFDSSKEYFDVFKKYITNNKEHEALVVDYLGEELKYYHPSRYGIVQESYQYIGLEDNIISLASNMEELDALYKILANDTDGLIDSDLELLEANRKLIEGNKTLEKEWTDSFKSQSELVSEMAGDIVTQKEGYFQSYFFGKMHTSTMIIDVAADVAQSMEDLQIVFQQLKDDTDGLTDADLEFLNANKALIESHDELVLSAANTAISLEDSIISTIDTINSTIDDSYLSSEAKLLRFNTAINDALSISNLDDRNALKLVLDDVNNYSSVLTDETNFENKTDMMFAQLSAKNKLDTIKIDSQNQLDHLNNLPQILKELESVKASNEAMALALQEVRDLQARTEMEGRIA